MKYFRLLGLLGLFLAFNASAVTQLNISGLSDEQKAILELQAAQMVVESNAEAAKPVIDNVVDRLAGIELDEESLDKYSNIGSKVGKIVTGFLTELGVAAADFLDTGWGMIAMLLVAWYYFANDMAVLMLIGMDLFVLMPLWVYFAKMVWFPYTEMNDGDGMIVKRKFSNNYSSNVGGWMIFILCVILLILIISVMCIG